MKRFCLILMLAGGRLASLAQTNAPEMVTDIKADSGQVDLNTYQIIYAGHVRVDYPSMKLTSAWLAADSDRTNNYQHILARTNVVIDLIGGQGKTTNGAAAVMSNSSQKWHVTSDQAVYLYQVQEGVTNKTVTISGHARAKSDKVTVTGEPLVYDLLTRQFSGNDYETIINNSAFSLGDTNAPAKTNSVSAPH